ncbi:glycosyltransferase [Terasakiella pusilla]|uniref:glycosyltransferase n=1 Tax=Terasakiella pusilla TaxID=64973 RepID=UPI00068A4EFD|nr:glycosyltransferase [Terasakiella pusilla]
MNKDILVVIVSLNRGGAEIHLSQVLPGLVAKGMKVKVFLLSEPGELADQIESQGVGLVLPWVRKKFGNSLLKVLKILLNSFQLFLYLLFKRPHIVHFFLPQTYLVGGLLSWMARNPVRLMSRRSLNLYLNKYPEIVRKIEYWLHAKMTCIIGNSRKVVTQLIEEEGVPKEKAHLIYNGIYLKKSQDIDLKATFGVSEESVILVMVANLIPYKGHVDLISALSKVLTSLRWDLLLIGNDSSNIREALEAQAATENIGDRVHFLGKRSDVVDILSHCDIGILASHEEGFSNAILEGMGSGLPMVVTDVGGNAEAIIDQECGLVVPAKAPDKIAVALNQLIESEALRREFGQAAKARFEAHFQLENCVQAYFDFYQGHFDK